MSDRRRRGQKIRIGVLLLILAGVAAYYGWIKHLEHWRADWTERQRVSVVLLVPSDPNAEERDLLKALERYTLAGEEKATFDALEHWFGAEQARYGGDGGTPVTFQVIGPTQVASSPPAPPRAGEALGFWERYRKTQAFLDYFEAERVRHQPQARNVIFVFFYRRADADRFRTTHSVADRRSRTGFVFCELSSEGIEVALINVAHELLHLYGARDEYEGGRCIYPEGYYAPFQTPRFPQRYAEVMAQGIPTERGGVEASPRRFEQLRVGVETAHEVGWISQERRDRYYRERDLSAGPADGE